MNISPRTKQIVKILSEQAEYITTEAIAEQLDVSSRTILRELGKVEKWLHTNGFNLEKKKGTGIRLDITEEEERKIRELIQGERVEKIFTPEERQIIMTSELLLKQKVMKLLYFTRLFNVTEGTLSHDLDKIEEWIKKYGLALVRKPGLGVYISGDEQSIRRATMDLFYEHVDQTQIINLVRNNLTGESEENSQVNLRIKKRLLDIIDVDLITKIEDFIDQVEQLLGYHLADDAYVALVMHLTIAMQRIKNNEQVKIEPTLFKEICDSKEYTIASGLIQTIAKYLNIDIPPAEIAYIAMHLKGSRGQGVLYNNEVSMIEDFKLIKIVKEMIRIAETETGYYLEQNEKLLIGLVRHLGTAMERIRMNLDIRNPLIQEIKQFYPELYSTAIHCAKVIENIEKIQIPESEVAYIAMHLGAAIEGKKREESHKYRIAIACASGIGASRLLSSRIEKEFKQLKIIDLISMISIDEKDLEEKQIDFIVSTVNIPDCSFPVIVVNPLLNEEHKVHLREYIQQFDKRKKRGLAAKNTSSSLKKKIQILNTCSQKILEVLDGFHLVQGITAETIDELIQKVSEVVVASPEEQRQLSADLKHRESLGSTLLEKREIMLLHCRTEMIRQLRFLVFRLQKPLLASNALKEKHSVQKVTLMLAPIEIEKIGLELLSEITKELIENEQFISRVEDGSEEEIYEELSMVLDRFYQQKAIQTYD